MRMVNTREELTYSTTTHIVNTIVMTAASNGPLRTHCMLVLAMWNHVGQILIGCYRKEMNYSIRIHIVKVLQVRIIELLWNAHVQEPPVCRVKASGVRCGERHCWIPQNDCFENAQAP